MVTCSFLGGIVGLWAQCQRVGPEAKNLTGLETIILPWWWRPGIYPRLHRVLMNLDDRGVRFSHAPLPLLLRLLLKATARRSMPNFEDTIRRLIWEWEWEREREPQDQYLWRWESSEYMSWKSYSYVHSVPLADRADLLPRISRSEVEAYFSRSEVQPRTEFITTKYEKLPQTVERYHNRATV